MSWLFSQALVADCLRRKYLDGAPWVPSSVPNGTAAYLCSDRSTVSWNHSRYGMTCGHLTEAATEVLLTSFLADFRAKHLARQREGGILRRRTCGVTCSGSSATPNQDSYSGRMSAQKPSIERATISKRWVMKPEQFPLVRQTWVATTFDKDIGYLHTPTTKGNYCAHSMRKWPCAKAYHTVFGKVTSTNHEFLMGWPEGWSDLSPLGTDKYLSWLYKHFYYLPAQTDVVDPLI